MRRLEFYWLDVFSDRELEGNQLAVFPNAEGISGGEMQKIALEMNLSETTFVTGIKHGVKAEETFNTRIFTKEEELPFAGHPTLGTSFLLRKLHNLKDVTLNLKVGDIPVKFREDSIGLYGEMRQNEPVFGNIHEYTVIADIFNVPVEELDNSVPIQTVSTGNPFILVPFRNLRTLQNIRPDYGKMADYIKWSDARFFYSLCFQTVNSDAHAHARMVFYGGEDPATGSAAGPATAWMLKYGLLKPDKLAIFEQGMEINRPSRIYVRGSITGGVPRNIRVGGYCSIVGKGEIYLSS